MAELNKSNSRTIYIAGKVTGLRHDVAARSFLVYEEILREKAGRNVSIYNPIKQIAKGTPWKEAMRRCIMNLVHCDEIHVLPGWRTSQGARLEVMIAKELGIKVVFVKSLAHLYIEA